MKHFVKCICNTCKKEFYRFPSQVQKYCSIKCYKVGLIGRIGYWKGKKLSKKHKEKMRNSRLGRYIREDNPNWKGGIISNNGYKMLRIPTHPFCDGKGYIRRSHIIMEKHIGRYISSKEVVHHINNIHFDDRIENLQLFPNKSLHTKFHNKNKNLAT